MLRPINVFLSGISATWLVVTTPAAAFVVTCVNCASEITQLANYVQLADQLARQAELVQNALKRYEDMLTNTKGLARQAFGDALGDLRAVANTLDQARSLSVAAADLDAQFAAKFKGYDAYVKEQLGVDGLSGKYRQWSDEGNASVLTALRAGKLQGEQMLGGEESLLAELERMAATAEGRMQALQVANQIALASARQTQKLRQLLLIQLQLQANVAETGLDRQAAQAAALDSFVKTGRDSVKTGDGKGY
jgi:P-type conjugative transfer protein TrbJ